jgi:hypothetical protein
MTGAYVSGLAGVDYASSSTMNRFKTQISMDAGYEFKNKTYVYSTASASEQFLTDSASDTHKYFNTKIYPAFGAGVGYNRTGAGLFGYAEQGNKVGLDKTTRLLSQVGSTFDVVGGYRLPDSNGNVLMKNNEVGVHVGRETYSARGKNGYQNYNDYGVFINTNISGFRVGAETGLEQHPDRSNHVNPYGKVKLSYNF